MSELNYISYCVSEALRFEPPVGRSSVITMTDDTTIGEYTLKAGDGIVLDMYRLQRNKD